MEISINLLPQSNSHKEKRSVYLIPILGIVAIIVALSMLTYRYFDTKDSIKTLSENIAVQTTTRDTVLKDYQGYTTGVTEYSYTDQYRALDLFLNNIYENTISLQKRVYRLLPEKAEVMTYTYSNNGELTMTISFYSKRRFCSVSPSIARCPFCGDSRSREYNCRR